MHKIHLLSLSMVMALTTTSQQSLAAAGSWEAAYADEMAGGPAVAVAFGTAVGKMIDWRASQVELKTKRLARGLARKTSRERLAKGSAVVAQSLQGVIPEKVLIDLIVSYCGEGNGELTIEHAHNDLGLNSWLPFDQRDNDMVRLRYRCIKKGTVKSGRLALHRDNSWSDVQAMIQTKTRISAEKQVLQDPRGYALTQLADLLDYFTDENESRVIWVKNSDSN